MTTAAIVTCYQRPAALTRSLPQIVALGWPVLVVDDGSEGGKAIEDITRGHKAEYLRLPQNRGLAAAMNCGLAYWLADPSVEWVSYFQDDVELRQDMRCVIERVQCIEAVPLLTCHDAAEHPTIRTTTINGVTCKVKSNCRATHLHARRAYWESVMPIRSLRLHAPHRVPGAPRGEGSRVDFWVVSEAPRARREVVCIPGYVRSFYWRAEHSAWDNTQRAGEDGPLRSDA